MCCRNEKKDAWGWVLVRIIPLRTKQEIPNLKVTTLTLSLRRRTLLAWLTVLAVGLDMASCPRTTHACTCPLPSFTSQTELTSSLVLYIPKQSSTIHSHGPLIWPGFHDTHANWLGPPAYTITNGESSSPIPQSHAHATLPSPQPTTPSRPSQPIDELSLHQNYQQQGSDLCPNSYPFTNIGCLKPNDQNSQFTTSARLIHSPPSQEEF